MNYRKLCKTPLTTTPVKLLKSQSYMNIYWKIINFHKYIIIKKMTKYKLLMPPPNSCVVIQSSKKVYSPQTQKSSM